MQDATTEAKASTAMTNTRSMIKGVRSTGKEPVCRRIPLVGRFKDAYAVANKQLQSDKARWETLMSKPLNKWTPLS
jgi:hypothetical protein